MVGELFSESAFSLAVPFLFLTSTLASTILLLSKAERIAAHVYANSKLRSQPLHEPEVVTLQEKTNVCRRGGEKDRVGAKWRFGGEERKTKKLGSMTMLRFLSCHSGIEMIYFSNASLDLRLARICHRNQVKKRSTPHSRFDSSRVTPRGPHSKITRRVATAKTRDKQEQSRSGASGCVQGEISPQKMVEGSGSVASGVALCVNDSSRRWLYRFAWRLPTAGMG